MCDSLNPLYIWCDVVFCPLLSECEEVVKAFHSVFWEIVHSKQTDSLRVGHPVNQGQALKG